MTADDTTPDRGQESIDGESKQLGEVGRRALAMLVEWHGEDLHHEVLRVTEAIRDGDGPTTEQVRDLRQEVDGIRFAVEDLLADAVDGLEPWEHDGERMTGEQLKERLEGYDLPDDLQE